MNNSKFKIQHSKLFGANDLIRDFDYKPHTPLAKGIEKFALWYRKFYGENV
jgi:nucleoside-diphosphate-sugar epimerase